MGQQSFLEDPGAHHQSDSATDASAAPPPRPGTHSEREGTADQPIEVSVTEDGRIGAVRLAPEMLRRAASGVAADAEWLAGEITSAVNAALDEFADQVRAEAGGALESLEGELDNVASGFHAALDKVASEVEQARQRLDS